MKILQDQPIFNTVSIKLETRVEAKAFLDLIDTLDENCYRDDIKSLLIDLSNNLGNPRLDII